MQLTGPTATTSISARVDALALLDRLLCGYQHSPNAFHNVLPSLVACLATEPPSTNTDATANATADADANASTSTAEGKGEGDAAAVGATSHATSPQSPKMPIENVGFQLALRSLLHKQMALHPGTRFEFLLV